VNSTGKKRGKEEEGLLNENTNMPIATFADLKKKNSSYSRGGGGGGGGGNTYKKRKPTPASNAVKNAPCTRCGRSTHLASACTNKTHIDGSKIEKDEKYCRDCGVDISDAPKHHKQCYDCFRGIEKPVWEKLQRGERVKGASLMTKEEIRSMERKDDGKKTEEAKMEKVITLDDEKRKEENATTKIGEEEEKKEKPKKNNAFADMFDWSRPTKSLEKCLKDNQRVREKEKDEEDQRKEKKEEKEQEEEILPESPPMFAGRDVDREKLTKSYEQTELAWNEESKKRKLEEDMKPIVIDDDDIDEEKEKERRRKIERRRVMLERAKKRLLGFREPEDKEGKKEQKEAKGEDWDANENPFWQPPMYIPAEGPCAEDLQISTDEYVEVRDTGLQWQGKYRACLDTGNGGFTLIQKHIAQTLGLCDALGRPTQSRWEKRSVQGVVAGVSESLYRCTLTYRLKGKEITCKAGITHARLGCDLLISRREIQEFERSGYTFRA